MRFHTRLGRERRAVVERLLVGIRQPRPVLWVRKGQDRHIPIKGLPRVPHLRGQRPLPEKGLAGIRKRQDRREGGGPFHGRLARDRMLHRVLRLDGLAARPAPSRSRSYRNLDAEPVRLRDGESEEFQPLFTQELHRPARRVSETHFQNENAADPGCLHGLKIGLHPLAGHIAVHEIPVDPGPRRIRRLIEHPLQRPSECDSVTQYQPRNQQLGTSHKTSFHLMFILYHKPPAPRHAFSVISFSLFGLHRFLWSALTRKVRST